MGLREDFMEQMKASMKAGDAPRTMTLRMIMAKLKDADIASRPKGIDKVPEDEIIAMLRSMVKSRRESVELYTQGNRPELAAKEEAEIAVIESFLPSQMDENAMQQAVADAVKQTGAASIKDMGMDMALAGPMVKARLGG